MTTKTKTKTETSKLDAEAFLWVLLNEYAKMENYYYESSGNFMNCLDNYNSIHASVMAEAAALARLTYDRMLRECKQDSDTK